LESINESNDLAYVIYTSGTTGKPKGVMVEHHGLCNIKLFFENSLQISEQDNVVQFASVSFDAASWEIFMALFCGATLYVPSASVILDYHLFESFMNENGITTATLPPTYATYMNPNLMPTLTKLITAGSASSVELVQKWKDQVKYFNAYGPTEDSICSSAWQCSSDLMDANHVSIGRPVNNHRMYIVDQEHHLLPIGVAGELCIAGVGLARGYLNRPELTLEKFVNNPFAAGERMYKTGDLARWLPDGNIEYAGRIDDQVKIRGYRIELGEVEAQFLKATSVQEAVVIAREDEGGQKHLCAYFVSDTQWTVDQLRAALSTELPGYMIPSYFVQLEQLPLTPNGKVDKKALPKPDKAAAAADFKAPETETQQQLADIWQNVLGIPRVGIQDNFFALGGDSIKAIQMASRLRNLNWKLEMKDLFQHPTIELVSPYLQRVEGKPADQGPVEGEVKLTPIQRWFIEQRFTDMHHWNQSVMLHAPDGFDPQAVAETLSKIMEHHDALRMVYIAQMGGYAQYNRAPAFVEASVEVVDFCGVSDIESRISNHANHLQRSINLSEGPLLKTAIFRTDQGDHLFIIIHHLVVDGVSWRILLEDFASGYKQAFKKQPIVFQEKTNSFKEWAEQLETFANSESFLKQSDFWRQIEAEPIMPLPKDNAVSLAKEKDSATLSFELAPETTRLLLTDVHRPYGTEINDILLCALGLVIGEWTGQSKLCLNLEGHGREEIMPGMNVSRTVGWFTAQYPVVLEINPDAPLPTLIKMTKESLRSIPHKGIGYGILRYLTASEHSAGLAFPLKPEISFNYLGQFDREVQTDIFRPSPYDMGHQISLEAESLFSLNFNGIIHGGRLIMSCSFNKQQYLRGTINELLDRFQHHLLQIIHHCASKEGRDHTPSDFSASNLRMDEMEDIFDALSEKLG
jgi:non-ribosomal peptide synthase protein (TIGR01720 family)